MRIVHIRKHDRYQLEIKTQLLSDNSKKSKGQVDFWLFLPPALGIVPSEYTPAQFYIDLRTYTRLKTPRFTAGELLSKEDSPLLNLERHFAKNRLNQKILRQEMKLLCSIVRKLSSLNSEVENLLLIQKIMERWRGVVQRLQQQSVKVKTTTCMKIVDELMSNYWEVSLIAAQEDPEKFVHVSSQQVTDWIQQEFQYRLDNQYFLYKSSKKDQYLFHFGNLVKYVSTVLFLDSNTNRFSEWLRHLALGTAAGLAMVWALFVQIYALIEYGVNLNEGMSVQLIVTFVGIGIFSYILKDRIKATSGSWLASQLSSRLPDRERVFYMDEEESPVAQNSEKAGFVKVKHLPLDIQQKYQNFQEWNPYFLYGSDVLHYHRQVEVFNRKAIKQFSRFQGVVDIHRFHVWNWVKTLAPPKKEIVVLTTKGKIERCKAPRVYTVNLLSKTTVQNRVEYQLFRVLLNNRGLVGVEEVKVEQFSQNGTE